MRQTYLVGNRLDYEAGKIFVRDKFVFHWLVCDCSEVQHKKLICYSISDSIEFTSTNNDIIHIILEFNDQTSSNPLVQFYIKLISWNPFHSWIVSLLIHITKPNTDKYRPISITYI